VRTPLFELHIRPLFRATDREHMIFAVDLWDYDKVVAQSDEILARLESDMPPTATGGPWPDEWVELFRRWTTTGHRRLELGTGQYAVSATPTVVTLTATGTYPAAGYRGWLQIETETDASKTYVLYLEPPEAPAAGSAGTFNLKERYRATDTRSVFVHDSAGVQQVH
jgi:hypothetical protein